MPERGCLGKLSGRLVRNAGDEGADPLQAGPVGKQGGMALTGHGKGLGPAMAGEHLRQGFFCQKVGILAPDDQQRQVAQSLELAPENGQGVYLNHIRRCRRTARGRSRVASRD